MSKHKCTHVCNFCNKESEELIADKKEQNVMICRACVALCSDIYAYKKIANIKRVNSMEDDLDFLTIIENAFAGIDVETERLEFLASGDNGTLLVRVGVLRKFIIEFRDAAPLPD